MPTMVFSGTKKSILRLGRLLISLANCQFDKTMLRAFLGFGKNDKIQVVIKMAKGAKGLQVLNRDSNLFGWGIPAHMWKEFSYTLALVRSGKIREESVDESFFENIELDITMGISSKAVA